MNKRSCFLSLLFISLISCADKNLENTTWKFCGESGAISDVLVINENYFRRSGDSISLKGKPIATIEKLEYHYGERRLYVNNNATGAIARYCEQ